MRRKALRAKAANYHDDIHGLLRAGLFSNRGGVLQV
jgi:hypothetical protein